MILITNIGVVLGIMVLRTRILTKIEEFYKTYFRSLEENLFITNQSRGNNLDKKYK